MNTPNKKKICFLGTSNKKKRGKSKKEVGETIIKLTREKRERIRGGKEKKCTLNKAWTGPKKGCPPN